MRSSLCFRFFSMALFSAFSSRSCFRRPSTVFSMRSRYCRMSRFCRWDSEAWYLSFSEHSPSLLFSSFSASFSCLRPSRSFSVSSSFCFRQAISIWNQVMDWPTKEKLSAFSVLSRPSSGARLSRSDWSLLTSPSYSLCSDNRKGRYDGSISITSTSALEKMRTRSTDGCVPSRPCRSSSCSIHSMVRLTLALGRQSATEGAVLHLCWPGPKPSEAVAARCDSALFGE
mmetsp:Transcript_75732/g.195151  ORF Transcript_75732/g.195151 Transcript_75732/m.195151 type:complete len:228 (-) Transcript_75732:266-949(-)